MWQKYGKTYAMLIATLVMAGLASYRALAVDGMTPSEWVSVVIALFTTITVWGAANIPSFAKAKTLMAAVGLVLNLLVSLIVGGITSDEWMFLAIQFLGALGVAVAPSVSNLNRTLPASRVVG
jgi:uncharacterized membrane protein (UPF0182 family)